MPQISVPSLKTFLNRSLYKKFLGDRSFQNKGGIEDIKVRNKEITEDQRLWMKSPRS